MAKRQLNEEEKKIILRQLKRLEEENKEKSYLRKYAELILNEGLEYSFNKQKKEYVEQENNLETELKSNRETIRILNDQFRNGVTIKEDNQKKEVNNGN